MKKMHARQRNRCGHLLNFWIRWIGAFRYSDIERRWWRHHCAFRSGRRHELRRARSTAASGFISIFDTVRIELVDTVFLSFRVWLIYMKIPTDIFLYVVVMLLLLLFTGLTSQSVPPFMYPFNHIRRVHKKDLAMQNSLIVGAIAIAHSLTHTTPFLLGSLNPFNTRQCFVVGSMHNIAVAPPLLHCYLSTTLVRYAAAYRYCLGEIGFIQKSICVSHST